MKVTIIGAGNMGRAIGTRAVAGGNDVEVIDRDPSEAAALANELGGAGKEVASATSLEPGDSIGGDVVVLALYYPSISEAIDRYGSQLAGRVVVDVSNPLDFSTMEGLATPAGSSAAEEIAKALPDDARVVKAFNTTFAKTLVSGEVAGLPLDVFIAGDDAAAKKKVAALVEGGGMRAIDVGPLRRSRQLEELGFLVVVIQEPLGTGYASAVKLHW